MKNILFLILVFSKNAFGLIPTLTASNSTPIIGEVFTYFDADTNVQEGQAGANITWTFNGLSITSNTSTGTCLSAPLTPYVASFPNSDIAILENDIYKYIISSSNGLKLTGEASMSDTVIFTQPVDYFTFPFTINSVAGTSNLTGTHSMGTFSGSYFNTGDGYGTLILNGNTINDVLRVKNEQDIIFTSTGLGNFTSHTVTFAWFDCIHDFPVFEISYTDIISQFGSDHSKRVGVNSLLTDIQHLSEIKLALNVFPNPANEKVNISMNPIQPSKTIIRIFDERATEVFNKDLGSLTPGKITESIDISNLIPGIYLLELTAAGTRNSRRLIIY